jgi:ABC-2 type transport system ATP-binding protein
MTGNSISCKGLSKSFGEVRALRSVSLEIQGGIYGLLGPNGAGKSTLVNILCGLQRADSGEASVAGFSIPEELPQLRAVLGVCPQQTPYYAHLTGRENLVLFGELFRLSGPEARERAQELVVRIGLEGAADRRAGTYSGGMARRLGLALALVNDSRVVFLDEPTVAMDPQSRRSVWELIRELRAQGRTVLLTSHYMEEVQQLADRVGIIDDGALVIEGTPAELISRYQKHDLEEVFLHLTGKGIREAV